MMMRQVMGTACVLACVAGCSIPVMKGESLANQKQLSFPVVGARSMATVGNVAALYSNYKSSTVFHLEAPLHMRVLLVNHIDVETDERLYQADKDGETVYCTERPVYYDNPVRPTGKVCFKSKNPGKFDSLTYLHGGLTWLSKDLPSEIGFTSRESAALSQTAPLKRELVFDGSASGTLMFTERIYEKSLETPSRIKPLMASVTTVPAKISLDGMDINVIHVDGKTLTFEVISPWQ
jgi:hypothetical protein